ncbi:pilus assembly protein PilM [Sediminibacillus albus]|uniref:Cell division protein FtsA n=1 Tax=Sediminibacillus albus TaxID=407036 RepID=A0A1G9BXD4_9BACI|nr:cell division FtsA domain-containing protein [Sediminibacillus albus]SDK44050.1 cell division protein FtsA [Sediminibacillus albus]
MNERIFALDIGTRSVIGLILEKIESKYQLVDFYLKEHEERAMLDGQIHDVVSVAQTIEEVKSHLEKLHGELSSVCVAAAGRALKTRRTKISKEIIQQPLMEKEDVLFLELNAVQQAQYELAHEESSSVSSEYYCVGYSVLYYELDEQNIGSLIDQQGKTASVEIIATFLPKVVVESLISALGRAGLEMEALTLEPIAAIDVLIPASMRKLNVALVDIGAGTSDIALTDDGTVTAYGMVPQAGDEITEALSEQYLLDFPQAEQMKRDLIRKQEVQITDILGFEQSVDYKDAVDSITSSIDSLADAICKEIMLLNNKAPKAVMLVGGGSMTPELTERIAARLELPSNRVAIRGIEAIPALHKTDNLPAGPAFVTPIGIAIAAKQNPVHYISVTVNDRAVRLFDMKQLTVGDCLLAAGINIDKLYGLPGMALIVELDGKSLTVPGRYGTAPVIRLNGEIIHVGHPIKHGDTLVIEEGKDGQPAQVTIKDLIGEVPVMHLKYNGNEYTIASDIRVNGKIAAETRQLEDRDKVTVTNVKTIKDFLAHIDKEDVIKEAGQFSIIVNGKKQAIEEFTSSLRKNNQKAQINDYLKNGDNISFISNEKPVLRDILKKLGYDEEYSLTVTFNDEQITMKKDAIKAVRDGKELTIDEFIYPGDQLHIEVLKRTPFIFQDIFRFTTIDLTNAKGNFHIYKNGHPTTFYEELAPHDVITLEWQ